MLRRLAARVIHAGDSWMRTARPRRTVLVYARNAMHVGVMDPVVRALERDRRLTVRYLAEAPHKQRHIDRATGRSRRWISRVSAAMRRIDVLLSADPWNPPRLLRGHRQMNFFHGVAGKYNLDDPSALPIGFGDWDRVAFINADRMQRYDRLGILKPGAAVLVGFPKLDALVKGQHDGAAVRARLGLDRGLTALYAPTWSAASSLNVCGERVIENLVAASFNVIVKPHDLSFDPDPKYSGGVDWRTRLARLHRPGRVIISQEADATPLMIASDLLVTDHSSIAFEFSVLDRPIIVIHAPDLARVARINPERIAQLRSAARVVTDPEAVGAAALDELASPERLSSARKTLVEMAFFDPGGATTRALSVVYELLEMQPQALGTRPRDAMQELATT